MAIASGIAVPIVYILESEGAINAFAAGFEPNTAVIIVTNGLLEYLNREELQGVIGHEFSHIFNGDMELNIKLTGAIAGLVAIAQAGRFLLDTTRRSHRSSRSSRREGNPLPMFGLALFVIGYIGVFLSNVLKAAVSRQREFLADATSAQYTRNPSSLAAALAKINFLYGSQINSHKLDEISHFLFADGIKPGFFSGWHSTHPPIEDRIEFLDPNFLNNDVIASLKRKAMEVHPTIPAMEQQSVKSSDIKITGSSALIESIGTVPTKNIEAAHQIIQKIPSSFRTQLTTLSGAKAAILGLLVMHQKAETQNLIYEMVGRQDTSVVPIMKSTIQIAKDSEVSLRGTIISLALPIMRSQTLKDKKAFTETLEQLIDHSENPADLAIVLYVKHTLLPATQLPNPMAPAINAKPHLSDLNYVFHWACHLGQSASEETPNIVKRAFTCLTTVPPEYSSVTQFSYKDVEKHLLRLKTLAPAWKKRVIDGLRICVLNDKKLIPAEEEALRAICSVLNVPVPLLI